MAKPDLRNLPETQRLVWARSERKRATLARAQQVAQNKKLSCRFCSKEVNCLNIARHEKTCKNNPTNIKICPVCSKEFAKKYAVTCSYSCSNTLYRSGVNNPNWNDENYKLICKQHHKFKCVVCPESRLLDVHHMDENRENNSPENLIFLCATHHRYWHSRYRHLIEPQVLEYLLQRKG